MLHTKVAILFPCLAFLFNATYLFAQGKSYRVQYDGYHYPAGNDFKVMDTRTTLHIIGNTSYSFDSSLPVKRPLADSGSNYPRLTNARQVYKDRSSGRLLFTSRNYLVEKTNYPIADTLFGFEWIYTGQQKVIENLPCSKALCIWRGRAYAASYTEEIPLPEGPWKFGGLPGLIVELYDEEKNFYWKLSGFKRMEVPTFEIPVAQKQYQEVVESFRKEARKRMAAALAEMQSIDPACKDCGSNVSISFPNIENWAY